VLNYQPQFDVGTGTISGMEALLRWKSDDLGQVAPAEFIPIAEETGLILSIASGCYGQPAVKRRPGMTRAAGGTHGGDVSGQQFSLKEFPSLVESIILRRASRVDARTRDHRIGGDEGRGLAEQALAQLKALGIMLAIDDFGTGYSSFGRLRNFAVDRLKIDQSFMTSLVECSDDRAIAAAIIAMSRTMRINVTAEGVENFRNCCSFRSTPVRGARILVQSAVAGRRRTKPAAPRRRHHGRQPHPAPALDHRLTSGALNPVGSEPSEPAYETSDEAPGRLIRRPELR